MSNCYVKIKSKIIIIIAVISAFPVAHIFLEVIRDLLLGSWYLRYLKHFPVSTLAVSRQQYLFMILSFSLFYLGPVVRVGSVPVLTGFFSRRSTLEQLLLRMVTSLCAASPGPGCSASFAFLSLYSLQNRSKAGSTSVLPAPTADGTCFQGAQFRSFRVPRTASVSWVGLNCTYLCLHPHVSRRVPSAVLASLLLRRHAGTQKL